MSETYLSRQLMAARWVHHNSAELARNLKSNRQIHVALERMGDRVTPSEVLMCSGPDEGSVLLDAFEYSVSIYLHSSTTGDKCQRILQLSAPDPEKLFCVNEAILAQHKQVTS